MYKETVDIPLFLTDSETNVYLTEVEGVQFWYDGTKQRIIILNKTKKDLTVLITYYGNNNNIGTVNYAETTEYVSSGDPLVIGLDKISDINNKCIFQDISFYDEDSNVVFGCNANLQCIDGIYSRFLMAWRTNEKPTEKKEDDECSTYLKESLKMLEDLKKLIAKYK